MSVNVDAVHPRALVKVVTGAEHELVAT
jgi:hypothetical protein